MSTALGPARLNIWSPGGGTEDARGRLVLGHGAGGGIGAPDLTAVRIRAVAEGWEVILVEQPWRVAGKRVAPAPARLDLGWIAALAVLASTSGPRLPLVIGGRSAGARVACRTALLLGAQAVCALAFPLHPPGRPERSRAAELAGAGVEVLVVQGLRDGFGTPAEISALGLAHVEVVGVPGDHGLSRSDPVAEAVARRLPGWAGV